MIKPAASGLIEGGIVKLGKVVKLKQEWVAGFTGIRIHREGYNKNTKIYISNCSKIKVNNVPKYPSSAEVADAKKFLVKPFADFPFSSTADFTNTIALILTPFIRLLFSGHVPMFGVIAPDVGTGKSLLCKTAFSIYSNNFVLTTAAQDPSEWHRKIFSLLLGGYNGICFDNVNTLDSEALSLVLTTHFFSDRVLGKSTIFSAPNNAIFAFTGNNPILSKELSRRTVFISLDAKSEKPWDRDNFKIKNLTRWVLKNRSELINSCLLIIQSWISANRPIPQKIIQLGSFENWAEVTAGILAHAGYENFLGNAKEIHNTVDIESDAWRLLIHSWHREYGTKTVKTANLYSLAKNIEGLSISGNSDNAQKKSLGIMLKKQAGRVYDDSLIVEAGKHQGAVLWKLDKIK